MDPIAQLVIQTGAVGALAYLVLHVVTKTLPALVERFAAEVAAERQVLREELAAFRTEMALSRAAVDKLAEVLRSTDRLPRAGRNSADAG